MRLLEDLYASRRSLTGFVVVGFGWAAFSAQMPVIKAQVGVGDGFWGTLVLLGSTGALMAMWLAPLVYRLIGAWALALGAAGMVLWVLLAGFSQGPALLGGGLVLVAGGAGVARAVGPAGARGAAAGNGGLLEALPSGPFSRGYAAR
ncbi:MAG: hypothetical protein AB3N17_15350, partial [Tateyamaria sp.]